MRIRTLPFFVLPLILASCFSSAIMQTAKPTPKGTLERSLGLSGYVDDGYVYPAIDGMLRTGLSEKSDIGLAYSLGTLGHLKLDLKHLIYTSPDQKMFFSAGIGVDGIWSEEVLGPINKDIGLTLPLYFSFNHKGKITPYFAQRLTLGLTDLNTLGQYNEDPLFDSYNLSHDWYYTGGGGIRWGEKDVKWFAELSYTFKFNRTYINNSYINPQGIQEVYSHKGISRSGTAQVTLGMFLGK